MFMEERQREISEKIKSDGKITVAYITENYRISDESARRDLRMLEQQGLCRRTHGGAISIGQVNVRPPADRDFSKMPIYENYRAIAEYAASTICENDTIYMTSGSIGWLMLTYLPRGIKYVLVTNSVDIAKELRTYDNIETYVAGGRMRPSGSLVDSLAVDFISRMHFDRCFITGAGLTAEFGLSNGTDETASFQRAVIKNSRKRTLLIPSSKVGADSFIRVCNAQVFTTIVTDRECAEDELERLRDLGIEVVIADTEVSAAEGDIQ